MTHYPAASKLFRQADNACTLDVVNLLWPSILAAARFILYIGWHWRNFFLPIYASCSGRRDAGQGNVNILQHVQSDRRRGASNKLFLNPLVQFYLNNVTNLRQLTSQNATSCRTTWRSYRDHRLLWRDTLYI